MQSEALIRDLFKLYENIATLILFVDSACPDYMENDREKAPQCTPNPYQELIPA